MALCHGVAWKFVGMITLELSIFLTKRLDAFPALIFALEFEILMPLVLVICINSLI